MAEKQKSLGSKLLGLFVVQEDGDGGDGEGQGAAAAAGDAPPPTGDAVADDLIARYAGGGPAAPRRSAEPSQAPAPAGDGSTDAPVSAAPVAYAATGEVSPAQLDFPGIYQKRGLSSEEQGHVERALTLLGNLPKETPQEVKRQIVAASLVAFGVPVDKIIESALLQRRVLREHVRDGQSETQAFLQETTRRLAELEAEMARIRKIAEDQLAHQAAVAAACEAQKGRIEEVLTFFGPEAAERVRAASPRLRDEP